MSGKEVPAEDLPDSPAPGSPVPPEDMPEAQAGMEVPPEDLPDHSPNWQTGRPMLTASNETGANPEDVSKLKTVAENLGQGAIGGLSTGFETSDPHDVIPTLAHMGNLGRMAALAKLVIGKIDPKDIVARQQAHPDLAATSQAVGELGANFAIPEARLFKSGAEGAGWLAKIGSKAINGAIQNGVIAGGDDVSKAMLGQGDPLPAVGAHIAEAGAAGLLLGALGGGGGHALERLAARKAEEKFGSGAISYLAGAGHALSAQSAAELGSEDILKHMAASDLIKAKDFQDGQKFFLESLQPKAISGVKYGVAVKGGVAGSVLGGALSGPAGAVSGGIIGERLGEKLGEKLGNIVVPKMAQKVVGPMLTRMAGNGNFQGVARAIDHGVKTAKGAQAIGKGIDSIFRSGSLEWLKEPSEKDREKVKVYQTNGGIDGSLQQSSSQPEQGFASGGEVQGPPHNPIAEHWPDQNMQLQAARARVSNYLNSVRPMAKGKLPFDSEHKDKHAEREYDKVVDMANNPLSVLGHIQKGSLGTKHMKDFVSMYPELHAHLSNKLHERMVEGQANNEKRPPYHVRQSLSLFLGTSLDSTLTQPSMAAAQNVFHMQKAQQGQQLPKSSSLNKVGQQSMTAAQSREARLNKN